MLLDARDARSVIGDRYDDFFVVVRTCRGEPAMLSQHDTTMLESLLQVPEKTVVKAMLANRIGVDGASAGNNMVEAYISRLRKKLVVARVKIRTVWGLGYPLHELDDDE